MIRKFIVIALGGTALAACEPETIRGGERADPMRDQLANAAPVELPPAIAASRTYRCKDNSLVRIDWLSDKTAYIHGEGNGQTHVKPAVPAEGQPASTDLVAEGGYAVKGDSAAATISVAMPGKSAQSCKA